MNEFVVNEYLSLRLENGKTNIYVNNEKFIQCKYILLDIPIGAYNDDEFESIDEYIEHYKKVQTETREKAKKLPPEVEFWGHCSNIHYWYLKRYDTNLIHHELVFPLLKALSNAGEMVAKNKFKEEIAKRYGTGYLPVMQFLAKGKYLSYLKEEEILSCAREALENNLRRLDYETALMLIRIFGRKLEAWLGREEYLHILLNKNDADVIIALGKLIGKEIIIKRYMVNGHYIRLRESYKDPQRSPGTAYSVEVRDKYVIDLNLSRCNLNFFPEIKGALERLTFLSLVNNSLKQIPKLICNLENLTILNLSGNLIQNIPQWINKLECSIYLTDNLLSNVFNKLSKWESIVPNPSLIKCISS